MDPFNNNILTENYVFGWTHKSEKPLYSLKIHLRVTQMSHCVTTLRKKVEKKS